MGNPDSASASASVYGGSVRSDPGGVSQSSDVGDVADASDPDSRHSLHSLYSPIAATSGIVKDPVLVNDVRRQSADGQCADNGNSSQMRITDLSTNNNSLTALPSVPNSLASESPTDSNSPDASHKSASPVYKVSDDQTKL